VSVSAVPKPSARFDSSSIDAAPGYLERKGGKTGN